MIFSRILLGLYFIGSTVALIGQQADCRLDLEELEPIISRFNPYFSNHQWSLDNRMELARMGSDRLLMITQDGCKRHHVVFTLVLDADAVEDHVNFWVEETALMMRKAYHEHDAYLEFGKQFESLFGEKFRIYGPGRRFNFPIGTRNFICEVMHKPGKGGRLMVEQVEYIFKDEANEAGQESPAKEDDGWLGHDRP